MRSIALAFLAHARAFAGQPPAIDALLNLKSAGSPRVSPDGTRAVHSVTSTGWKQDDFVSQLWMVLPDLFGDPRPDFAQPVAPETAGEK